MICIMKKMNKGQAEFLKRVGKTPEKAPKVKAGKKKMVGKPMPKSFPVK